MLKVDITSFSYGETEILNSIAFELRTGEHLFVLGESGCGKTTLLHLVYGLLDLDHGSINWKDSEILGPKHNLVPGMEFIKLVAQEYNVMPYTTVIENVTEHLSRLDLEADRQRAMELLEVVDLVPYSNSMVKQLSGGQKQRVALAKALANEPELLLLDEPFSHIDTFRKNKLRRKLYSYLKEKGISCITATHDPSEALSFSDNILLLNELGKMEAFGSPESIYNAQDDLYSSSFFDDVTKIDGKVYYPHQLRITDASDVMGSVAANYFRGSHYLVEVHSHGGGMMYVNADSPLEVGKTIGLKPK